MRWLLFFPVFIFSSTMSSYFDLQKDYPTLFENQASSIENEIELILDPDHIQLIEKNTAERLLQKGINPEFSKVGIVAEDQYLYWIRDAVTFPSGFEGTYDRILWKASKNNTPGVAVLIELPDNTFALNINFRHATRSWELELPRGLSNKGESLTDTAKREAKEETGYLIENPVFLGWVNPDSGILASSVAVFYAKAENQMNSEQEETEAIESIEKFTKDEIYRLLGKGFFTTTIAENHKQVFVRDSFLTYALCLYQEKIQKNR